MTLNGYIAFLTIDLALACICASALLRLNFIGNPRHQSLMVILELVLSVWVLYTSFSYFFLIPAPPWWPILIAFVIYHMGLFFIATDMAIAIVLLVTQFIVIALLSFFVLAATTGPGIFLSIVIALAIAGLSVAAQKIYRAAFELYGHEMSDETKEEIESIGEIPGSESSLVEKLLLKAAATTLVLFLLLYLISGWI